ncbi:hypothetical protein ACHQM5_005026 [Ranunculus cassubicifolius]
MVRASKKQKPVPAELDEDRIRLKKLAISHRILSRTPANLPNKSLTLNPSKTVVKHHGKDIIKKSQRKNRFLFSFPGLLAPISGGKIGELKDLGTKNPVLYLDFPQGRVKVFGTIVHPKNRYLTLQFSKGGKNVMCEDHFDNMVVFSDAWWIGKKDENPEELRLDFPNDLIEGKHTDSDFKGGAGASATSGHKTAATRPRKEYVEPESPSTDIEDDSEDISLTGKKKDFMEVTPVRQSARTAGKKFKFQEGSSGDSSPEIESESPYVMKEDSEEKLDDMTEDPNLEVQDMDSEHDAAKTDLLEHKEQASLTVKSKESSISNRASLVQATISSLFAKAKGKEVDSKQKVTPAKVASAKGRKSGTVANSKKKKPMVEDDDIEEISSESEDIEESDEEWAA